RRGRSAARHLADVPGGAREPLVQSRHDVGGSGQARQRPILSPHGARRIRAATHARCRRPLPCRLVTARRWGCRRGPGAGGHHSAGDAESPLHLCTARPRPPGARQYGPGAAGIRRLPASRASRVGAQTLRVRRPPRVVDKLPCRSGTPGAEAPETGVMTATISRTIHVAHSPDADDAFMFWAMAQGKIDTGDRRYVHELGDIESLNRRALAGELEVTAV